MAHADCCCNFVSRRVSLARAEWTLKLAMQFKCCVPSVHECWLLSAHRNFIPPLVLQPICRVSQEEAWSQTLRQKTALLLVRNESCLAAFLMCCSCWQNLDKLKMWQRALLLHIMVCQTLQAGRKTERLVLKQSESCCKRCLPQRPRSLPPPPHQHPEKTCLQVC